MAGWASAALCAAGLALGSAAAHEAAELARGQTVYVPVYSQISHGNIDRSTGRPATLPLSSMLSIRNIDPERSLTLRSVRYHDGDGKLLREYLQAPRTLGPLASAEVFVEHKDVAGGSGASFLVVWDAEQDMNAPVIETVNAYFFGTQSIAFTSPGRPLARR
jgi:hypothetical protein